MTDYSCHRPKDYSWLSKYTNQLGVNVVLRDYEAMCDWLLSKPVGWSYNLEQSKSMRDVNVRDYKIKLICTFIADNNYDFEFNKTFTQLKRVKINVKQKKLDTEGNTVAD